jgi:hypothetical protein
MKIKKSPTGEYVILLAVRHCVNPHKLVAELETTEFLHASIDGVMEVNPILPECEHVKLERVLIALGLTDVPEIFGDLHLAN